MQDSTAWTVEQHQEARAQFTLYKSELRPLIREGDLFHVSERPDGLHWDGIEYFNKVTQKGILFSFRGGSDSAESHSFRLAGLSRARNYRVAFHDRSSTDFIASGQNLMTHGVTVHANFPNSSELIFIDSTSAHD